jgi:hypothetical protein
VSDDQPRENAVQLYPLLCAPFDHAFQDVRAGVRFDYLTGEQVISRLNRLLGFENWSFRVLEHGINIEADEVWVLGELRVTGLSEETAVRQQFGSQHVRRSRANGVPVEIGSDLKGATTDCLKKCASLIGVGLYLSRKDEPALAGAIDGPVSRAAQARIDPPAAPVCVECGAALGDTTFSGGVNWTASQLAEKSRGRVGRVLCVDHFRQAVKASRAPSTGNRPRAMTADPSNGFDPDSGAGGRP